VKSADGAVVSPPDMEAHHRDTTAIAGSATSMLHPQLEIFLSQFHPVQRL